MVSDMFYDEKKTAEQNEKQEKMNSHNRSALLALTALAALGTGLLVFGITVSRASKEFV